MIKKFDSISNLAVFNNFEWDTHLSDKGNNAYHFNRVNILYGRNYSGKTTLSRIVRAMETGEISDKYENCEFDIHFKDGSEITHDDLKRHRKNTRVFNEDFVKDNLSFIYDPEGEIAPFAVMGDDNTKLEREIREMKKKLGSDKQDEESGMNLALKRMQERGEEARQACNKKQDHLNKLLKNKSNHPETGIRNRPERFGDQNYNINKLKNDITTVTEPHFKPLTEDEVEVAEKVIDETKKKPVKEIGGISIDFDNINARAETLVTQQVGKADRIEELMKEAVLNRWVQQGKVLHEHKREDCAFCGNPISEGRWQKLDRHFDEESIELEDKIEEMIKAIEAFVKDVDNFLPVDENDFYFKFHKDLEEVIERKEKVVSEVKKDFNSVIKQLQARKKNIFQSGIYHPIRDRTGEFNRSLDSYATIRKNSNQYSLTLGDEQDQCKKLLRLKEVFVFVNAISYLDQLKEIEDCKRTLDKITTDGNTLQDEIEKYQNSIQAKEEMMSDMQAGAKEVNEYLNNYFGHDFLRLQPIEKDDKVVRFEVHRHGIKAYHLSEGECSLIAFCYFLARLNDHETHGQKPIIWIDDPISSLDSNHIFFVHSLIKSQIVEKEDYTQLFISTHNLEFLKYLKRVHLKGTPHFYLVVREGRTSQIQKMPEYLKDHVTEFNFLFHQIYRCAYADTEETNMDLFYNFGNNVRKFLEIYLYFRYPTQRRDTEKMKDFFGDTGGNEFIVERISNEFSHLKVRFERGMNPVDVPEMQKAANFILNKIEEKDPEQYNALVESVTSQRA